jgi:hypothetical protein
MGDVLAHSRCVDRLGKGLLDIAGFVPLFWHQPALMREAVRSLKGSRGQAVHCMALVRVAEDATANVHRLCGDEQTRVGNAAVNLAHAMLTTITNTLAACVARCMHRLIGVHTATTTTAAVLRLNKQGALPGRFDHTLASVKHCLPCICYQSLTLYSFPRSLPYLCLCYQSLTLYSFPRSLPYLCLCYQSLTLYSFPRSLPYLCLCYQSLTLFFLSFSAFLTSPRLNQAGSRRLVTVRSSAARSIFGNAQSLRSAPPCTRLSQCVCTTESSHPSNTSSTLWKG